MRILDNIYLALINLRRNKKFLLINISLISISLLILIVSSIASESINNLLNKYVKDNISYRSIFVRQAKGTDEKIDINNIKNIEHISKVIEQFEFSTHVKLSKIQDNAIDGSINLMGCSKDISPNIIKGRNINDKEDGVCIVPKKLYPYELEGSIDENNIIDGENLLNKYISIQYSKYDYSKTYPEKIETIEKKYKVIGVYDTNDNRGEINECYTSYEEVFKINNVVTEGMDSEGVYRPIIAIVDNSENVESVLKNLETNGYTGSLKATVNADLINIINIISLTITTVMLVLVFFNIIINGFKSINDRCKEIGILKAIGYKRKDILLLLSFETLLVGLISFILTVIFSIIVIAVMGTILENSNYEIQKLKIIITYKPYLYAFLIGSILPILAGIFPSIKLIKKPAIAHCKGS